MTTAWVVPGAAGVVVLCSGEFKLPGVIGTGTWGVATELEGEDTVGATHFVQIVEV